MSNTIGERVAAYLDLNRTEILASWMGKVIVYNNDPHKDLVRMNGSLMLDMLIASAKGIDIDDEKLRELSHKVSYERVQSNVNMGDYAYNIAVGRSEIFDHLPKIGEPLEDLFPVFSRFSVLFDKFLYFAGHHYTELKNQQLLEQSSFIEKTHQDKLTILGQMSSSFVHEFRNPLTSIIGFVQLLRDKYPSLEYIDILTMELNQLKFRITQFLLLSKRGADLKKKEYFVISQVVDQTLDFLYPMVVSSNVAIERDIADLCYLIGYRDEFCQALINILMNSLDAISVCDVKMIRITGHTEGGSLVISISNNGPAIPQDMLLTIFEPFVSSKKLGTGIGLYLCKKIIEAHGGIITCESDDETTTFRMVIPLIESLSD